MKRLKNGDYSIDEIRRRVDEAASDYNSSADDDNRIEAVTLFGSYADGRETNDSDVDLLVRFSSPIVSLFSLARTLEAMEKSLEISVDVVQEPLPEDALLNIEKKVLLYEARRSDVVDQHRGTRETPA